MVKGRNRQSVDVEKKELEGIEMFLFEDVGIAIVGDGDRDPKIVPWATIAWFTPRRETPDGELAEEQALIAGATARAPRRKKTSRRGQ